MKFEVTPTTELDGYQFSFDATFGDGWMARVPFNTEQDLPEIFRGLAAAAERHFALTPAEKRAKLVALYEAHGLEVPSDTKPTPVVENGRITSIDHDALLEMLSIKR